MTYRSSLFAAYWAQHQAAMPTDGLAFWHPLDSLMATTPTGQGMDYAPELTSERVKVVDNVPCIDLSDHAVTAAYTIRTSAQLALDPKSPVTMSIWVRPNATQSTSELFYFGDHPYSARILRCYNGNSYRYARAAISGNASVHSAVGSVAISKWNHLAMTMDGDFTLKLYVNGLLDGETAASSVNNVYEQWVTIGCYGRGGQGDRTWFNGCVAGARLYSLALPASEISALSREFTPSGD